MVFRPSGNCVIYFHIKGFLVRRVKQTVDEAFIGMR